MPTDFRNNLTHDALRLVEVDGISMIAGAVHEVDDSGDVLWTKELLHHEKFWASSHPDTSFYDWSRP